MNMITGTPASASTSMNTNGSTKTNLKKAHVLIIGAGNIGTHLVPLVAALPEVGSLTVLDRDAYEPSNIAGQAITLRDAGRPKARVQAEAARRVAPGLHVEAIQDELENVPLGRLRADVVLTGLDSRGARQCVNQAVHRLGVRCWIDGGVEASGCLARVSVFNGADPGAPCYECGWGPDDYENLTRETSCLGEPSRPAPTHAPRALGAVVAGLMALELKKYLAGQAERVAFGRELLLDALHHRWLTTELRRDPGCRCAHEMLERIHPVRLSPRVLTLADAFALGATTGRLDGCCALRVPGRPFVRQLVCPRDGATVEMLGLHRRLPAGARRCPECGASPMIAAGMGLEDSIHESELPAAALRRTLSAVGLRAGDIFTLIDNRPREAHFELAG